MAAPAQRDFRMGEVAPSFYGRADLGMYGSGLRTLRNAYVKRMGGITSRPGTLYKGTTKGNGAVQVVDAVFDDTENYVVEFGNGYLRIWQDGALVEVSGVAAWVTATAYVAGDVRSNGGVNYVCILAHTSGASTEPGTGASWETNWYALTDAIYEYPTDYTTAQLDALQFAAQYRVLTVVHPSHPPATLTFDANGLAVLADIDFALTDETPDNVAVSGTSGSGWGYTVAARFFEGGTFREGPAGNFVRTNTTGANNTTAYALARAADPRTITWDAVPGAVSYRIYLNRTDGGTTWYINTSDDSVSYVDNGVVWVSAPTGGPIQITEVPFSTAGEYPSAVGAYQQRLVLSGSTNDPDVVRASQSANPYDFGVSNPIVDSDALSWRQVGQRLNRVRFFREVAQRLLQFSSVGEVVVQGDVDGILRPGEVNPRLLSENGISPNVPPLVAGDAALYVQARGNQVMDLWPDGSGSEISRSAWHLLDGYEVVSWCFQRVPDRVVWAVRNDGRLLSLTYNREDQVLGWALHDTDGSFERVVCVPEGDEDAVYVVVNRTIDGNTVRYVERLADRLADTPIVGMDAAVTVTTSATSGPRLVPAGFGAWTKRGTTLDSRYSSIAVSTSEGVGLALGNVDSPIIRTTDGVTWATVSAATSDYLWYDVIRSEALGLYIAVGTGDSTDADNVVMTSPTGEAWTLRTAGFTDDDSAGCVVFAPAIPLVIVSDLDGTDVLTSSDGLSYTESATSGLAGSGMVGMAAHPTTAVIVGCDGVALYRTANGVAWTAVTLPAFSGPITLGTDVVWTGDVFVCGVLDDGDGGTGLLTGTADGVTWTYTPFSGAQVGFNPDRLVWNDTDGALLVMQGSGIGATTDALVTTDLMAFTAVTMQVTQAGRGVWASAFSRFIVPDAGTGSDTESVQDATYASALRAVGLEYLDGESVSIYGGGGVIASPYNPDLSLATVTGGTVTVDSDDALTSVTVGLPVVTDIQTLDIETVNGTRKDAGILVNRIGLWLEDTLGLSARSTAPSSSTSLDGFQPLPVVDEDANTTTDPVTGYREVTVDGVWTRGGRIFLRNVDPTPVTIHSIAVQGQFGRS